MNGAQELARLADLLRLGAQTARQVALLRPQDQRSIEGLALQAEDMADQLDAMVAGDPPAAPGSADGDP